MGRKRRSCNGNQDQPDAKGNHSHPVYIHAHKESCIEILGCGPDGFTGIGLCKKQPEGNGNNDSNDE